MKILFVTSYPLEYSSSANVRNMGLIEGLVGNGHQVFTYSPYPTDTHLFDGNIMEQPFAGRYWLGGIKEKERILPNQGSRNKFVEAVRSWLYKKYNYFRLYDRRSMLVNQIDAKMIDQRFDVIISSSDPKSAHLFAEELICQNPKLCIKWIQYWGDPFSDDISSKRFRGSRRALKEERRLLDKADKAEYVSPFTVEDMIKKHPAMASKMEFLPIPYRMSNTKGLIEGWNEPVVGYLGDYNSSNRNIMPLYKALCGMELTSYIVGNSNLRLNSTNTVHVHERLVGSEFKPISDSINIYVCLCNLNGTQIPGKVYHYVNSGKPIVIIVDGDYSERLVAYFESFNRFYICENTVQSITSCIKKVVSEKRVFDTPDSLNPISIADKFIKI